MIWLSVFLSILLLSIVAIIGKFALKLRHGDARDHGLAEQKEQVDFRRDEKNDSRLVQQIELGSPGLADATAEYIDTRIAIAPNANSKIAANWTQDDYRRWKRNDLRSKRSNRISKMAWSAGKQAVCAFAIATIAGAFLYQNLTTTTPTDIAPQTQAASSTTEIDPFADPVVPTT